MNQVTKSRHSNYFNWNLILDIILNSVPRKLILFKKYFTNALSSHILKNKDQSISLPCFISKINMLKRATLGIWGKSCADPDYFGLVGGISSAGEGSFFRYFYYMNLIRLSIFCFWFWERVTVSLRQQNHEKNLGTIIS